MNGEQVSICMAQPDFPLGGLHEALSERLIRNGALETWRDLFLGSAYGTIRFETEIGRGTTFIIRLPLTARPS